MNDTDELIGIIEMQQREINALENTLHQIGGDNMYEKCLFKFNRYLFEQVQRVMPKEEFKGLVMEAVAEMYNHMPDFLAEDIAHDMQYRVKFQMNEIDDIRNKKEDDGIPF